ncbi:hypothetical protein ACFLZH_05995 [Patescibacteria group bacterium]
MENPSGEPERPKDYAAKLAHFKNIKQGDIVRFRQAIIWMENIIKDEDHPDRQKLFSDWTEDDLRSLLKDALDYEKNI